MLAEKNGVGVMVMKTFSIRIDDQLLHKVYYIAYYESRSGNGEVLFLLRQAVKEFEIQHGPIPLSFKKGNSEKTGSL